ncbi:phage/plasmid replication protein, II/X family [uncultured Pseudoalteromonas sp.]|uniref:phage/plasmid replication protein, II/X family n=2 Tax=uncultured Pseudoalteromonas sp. TaxID=114053 RepID=UPI0030F9D3BA
MSNISDFALEKALLSVIQNKEKVAYNPEFKRTEETYNPTLQIDWITAKIPFFVSGKLNGGNIINTTPDGEIEYTIDKRLPVTGSYDSRLSVRTAEVLPGTNDTYLIELSGNPVKWFQGHNIFGSDDLPNLIYETVLKLSKVLNLPQPEEYLSYIRKGIFTLSRVDITAMYSLQTRSDVYSWLNHAEKTCRTRSGTAMSKGTTVYMNKTSQRWNVVMYSKGQELEKHNLPKELEGGSLETYADNKLRVELRLKQKELAKIGLSNGKPWLALDVWPLFKDYVGRIDMTEQAIRSSDLFEIPKHARMTYELWSLGRDVRQFMGKTKYYKDRKALLEMGIDISVPKPVDNENINVVPLKRVLELKPAGIPDWAYGTNLVFEPRKLCN